MESGRNKFPVRSPFLAVANEQSVAQPWLEESILARFRQVDVAVQNNFDIARVGEENDNIISKKSSHNMSIDFSKSKAFTHDLCEFPQNITVQSNLQQKASLPFGDLPNANKALPKIGSGSGPGICMPSLNDSCDL